MPRALIVVDCQVDFCEGGSLAVTGGAEVASKITEWIIAHTVNYAVVVATKDFHEDPGDHFSENPDFVDSWPAHCVVNTPGAEFHPNFNSDTVDEIFRKGRKAAAYSGFEGESLAGQTLLQYLNDHEINAVDVVGIATDYCVKATALDAVKYGFDTRVILDLTAAVAEPTRAVTMEELAANGVKLVHLMDFEDCRYCNHKGLSFD